MATTTTFSRDKRSQNPRKVFSPSTASVSLPTHYLIYMEDTVSFLIVARTSIKHIQGQMASLIINKKKLVGEIVVSGTFVRCQTELNKIQKTSQSMDEDSNESESENCQLDEDALSVEEDQENNKIQDFGEESEAEKSPDENFNNRSSNKKRKSQPSYLSQSKKRLKRRILDENIDNESDNEEEIALCLAPKKCKNSSNKDDRLKSIENKMDDFNQCMKKMSHSMRQMASYSNKITSHNLDIYRDPNSQENFTVKVDHNGTDLVTIVGRDFGDFAREVMRVLYSEEERKTHILPPGRPHLSRKPLDSNRFALLNDAVRVKYRLSKHLYDDFFKYHLRPKLSDFLVEERRRESNKIVRNQAKSVVSQIATQSQPGEE